MISGTLERVHRDAPLNDSLAAPTRLAAAKYSLLTRQAGVRRGDPSALKFGAT